ncbi:Histone-arginine methyltransferase CARMER [Orchesella cincta]|uniref:type I protein arginine methyltransferase n=1 Tax=Orchesella cincta TaxID=48709 RepID=A0A1D2M9U3_ORCCI|nr:Histone-arginine methyltransferase CARMER [Orchesella cincta]
MTLYNNVKVYKIMESGENERRFPEPVVLRVDYDPQGLLISFLKNGETNPSARLYETLVEKSAPPLRIGRSCFVISTETEGLLVKIPIESDAANFQIQITKGLKGNESSVFAERTEDSSALQYFQFYGYLSQQQNMMQDYIRTATYQKAILLNVTDFEDKVVLDVGAGSGILSFFACQAGARKVYAVEASSMAVHAEALAASNGLGDKLKIVAGKIEEIELPEKVDIIISEPMGYMLFNERMLETYLHAKKWLKPTGKMFPSKGDLHVAPFSDEALYMEQCNKANFWQQNNFHGVDLSSLKNPALKEYFRQPIVDTFDVRICLAQSVKHTVDFLTASEFDLHEISIPLEFEVLESGTIHGLAFWFDVAFEGRLQTVWLSTAPTEPLTHWYQVRCLIDTPLIVKQNQVLYGNVRLSANKRQSYDVLIELDLNGKKASNNLDLKNPYFRYTGQPPQPPPGHHTSAPSDSIWTTVDTNGRLPNGGVAMNGSVIDGLNTFVDMAGAQNMMGVIPGAANLGAPHQVQANASVTHYTTLPLLGDYVAAAGANQNVLLSTSNVNVIPTPHNMNWSH